MAKEKKSDKPEVITPEENAFGIEEEIKVEEEQVAPEKEEQPAAEEAAEEPGVNGEGETPPEEGPKPEEEEPGETPIEEITPEIQELMDKKGFASISELVKSYTELEKGKTKTDQLRSTYRKALDPYAEFDGDGNIIGVKPAGKRVMEAEAPAMTREEAGEKFKESWEKDPVGTILGLGYLAAQQTLKEGKYDERLKPLEEEFSDTQLLKIIDRVAVDSEDEEFFDQYEEEIATEVEKLPEKLRKEQPEAAVRQAYLQVKSRALKKLQEGKPSKEEKPSEEETHLERPGKGAKKGPKTETEEVFEPMKEKGKPKGVFF